MPVSFCRHTFLADPGSSWSRRVPIKKVNIGNMHMAEESDRSPQVAVDDRTSPLPSVASGGDSRVGYDPVEDISSVAQPGRNDRQRVQGIRIVCRSVMVCLKRGVKMDVSPIQVLLISSLLSLASISLVSSVSLPANRLGFYWLVVPGLVITLSTMR